MTPTTGPPPPGSGWAARCPDAYPGEWFAPLNLTALPPGFTRFATAGELAVITGGGVPAGTRHRPGRRPAREEPPSPARAGDRFRLINGFADFHMAGLSAGDVKVWLLLFRDARGGIARTGQADLARRAGLSVRGVQKVVGRLGRAGLLAVVRRGGLGTGPSAYRLVLPGGVAAASVKPRHDELPGRPPAT